MCADHGLDLTGGRQFSPRVGLDEVLRLLAGPSRTGCLSAVQDNVAALEVWFEHGLVVDAVWGEMRSLSALEMGAIFLPDASFVFVDASSPRTRSFNLSPIDLALRLAQVSYQGATLARTIPGPQAVPLKTGRPRPGQPMNPDAVRLLDQIDGRRTVAALVDGKQPLAVLRSLAVLVDQGAISFQITSGSAESQPGAGPSDVAAMPEHEAGARSPEAAVDPSTSPQRWLPTATPLMVRPLAALRGARVRPFGLVLTLVVVALATCQAGPRFMPGTIAPAATPFQPAPTPLPSQLPPLSSPATAVPASVLIRPSAAPTTGTLAAQVAGASVSAVPAARADSQVATPPVRSPRVLLDQTFTVGAPGWPDAPTSSAWWDALGYHLLPRLPGRHVAVAAPISPTLGSIAVTALFRKIGGPDGGGYGLVLRGQGGPLDGVDQGGRFYVFAVGDRGEVGAWRRDEDHWVDLLAWTASQAVHPGSSDNSVSVTAAGARFTFTVNDIEVTRLTDTILDQGATGVFAGGDGNEALLERFTVTVL